MSDAETERVARALAALPRCVGCRSASGPIARRDPPARCQNALAPHYSTPCIDVSSCAHWEPK